MTQQKAISIIERNDYQRATEKLQEKVSDVAEAVRIKMEELNIKELQIGDSCLYHKEIRVNGTIFNTLTWEGDPRYSDPDIDLGGDLELAHEMRTDFSERGTHPGGDYNYWINYPSRSAVMKFAREAQDILKALEYIESEQARECENLANTL